MEVLAAQCVRPRSRCSTKKALNTEVPINLWPVDSNASASNIPVVTLPRGGEQEARLASKRHRDGANVSEVGEQLVLCAGNICGTLARISHEIRPILSPR
jgi:hypothetical protein